MTIEVFIKKPEKVEVLKYDGTNYDEVVKFAGEEFQRIKGCFVNGDYIIKSDKYKIVASSSKPDFAKQDLIGTYNKDAFQGVNSNVHMSLEKLQESFEVPIISDRKGVNNAANNNCGIKKYCKKLIIVEAMQNTGGNVDKVMMFTKGACRTIYTPKGFVYRIMTPEGKKYANVGDYIVKDDKGKFYPCKPDVFEATYDEYTEQQNSNHTSKLSSSSLRDLVMRIAPKHIKYYVKRLEEYGFKLKCADTKIAAERKFAYSLLICLADEIGNNISIVDENFYDSLKFIRSTGGRRYPSFELFIPHRYDVRSKRIEVKNNNWREAFNKLVASFPDSIMKNTNR